MKLKRFLAIFITAFFLTSLVIAQDFTQDEKKFISSLPTLTVMLSSTDWPFTDFSDSQTNQSLVNYFDYLSNLTGINFELISEKNLYAKTVNLVGNARYSSSESGEKTTIPYFYSYKSIVEKNGETHKDFAKPQKIGTTSIKSDEISVLKQALQSYQNSELVYIKFDNPQLAIDALTNKEIDCVLLNQYSLYVLQEKPEFEKLRINPKFTFEDNFCIQVINLPESVNEKMLISILNKAISVQPSIMNEFVENSIKNQPKISQWEYAKRYKWEFLLLILIFCIVFFGILLFFGQNKRFSTIFTSKSMQLETLSENLNTGIVEIDLQSMKIEYANTAFLSIVQSPESNPDMLDSELFTNYIAKHEVDKFLTEIGRLNILTPQESLKKSFSLEIRILRRDGSTLPVIMNASLSPKKDKKSLYIIMFDNSSQIFALEKYQSSNEKFESIMEKTNEVQYDIDLVTGVISADDNLVKKMGWTFPHKISKTDLPSIWHLSKQYESEFRQVLNTVLTTGETKSTKVKLKKSSGIDIWCEILLNPIQDEKGEIIRIFGTIEDVDFETREKELIMFKADTDPLTGLYQKEAFFDRCKKFIADSLKAPGNSAALIFMDMDNFKQINDILGHLEGDNAICDAAKKLQLIFSQYDIISRFGGDEFCIFVKNIPIETLKDKLNWLVEKMKQTYTIGDNSVMVTASIGVSLFPKDGSTLEQLLNCADKALYESKANGKNQYSFF